MPEFVEPDDIDNDEPTESDDKPQPATDQDYLSEDDLPTVRIDGEEVPFTVAVESMAAMVDSPEAFGVTTKDDHTETRNEISELREQVEQQGEAIAELATAIESLGEVQSRVAGVTPSSTIQLDSDAFGDIYTPVDYMLEEFEDG